MMMNCYGRFHIVVISLLASFLLPFSYSFSPVSIRTTRPLESQTCTTTSRIIVYSSSNDSNNHNNPIDKNRRGFWPKSASRIASLSLAGLGLAVLTKPVWAATKSRTKGYAVQKSNEEWRRHLSPRQYEILRNGGTERPFSSSLEAEKRAGIFICAGCRSTPLFDAQDKFNSGTGWPSFARAMEGVEVETIHPFLATLGGAEVRCRTCGGHLGDVFRDGYIFVGTEAARTGKRYCIDGAALIFQPSNGGAPLRGDVPST